MRIAVCDDCREDAIYLKALLKENNVKIYTNAEEFLSDIEEKQLRFDLYMLDIFIEDSINGIELADRLRKHDAEAVICFVSTSDDFYREAYDIYAVQYLIKPVQEKDINRLLEKVHKNHIRKNNEQSISFRWQGEIGSISYDRILYISSRKHNIFIHCRDGRVQETTGKLNDLEKQMCGDIFMRCHQSFIVNMYHVERMIGTDLMVNGEQIPVSRRYHAEVKKRYQKILFEEVD